MAYIDTHIHLDLKPFAQDLEEVLRNARKAGVDRMITVGTDLNSSRASVALAEKHRMLWAAAGIHPHEAANAEATHLTEIERMTRHPRVVAVGEIGLDYHYDFSPRHIQKKLFLQQLKMSRRFNLPAIIHVREAMEDALEIIDTSGEPPWRGVFHCYGGTAEEVPEVLSRGFHISFTGVVTFKNFKHADAVKAVPLDRLLLETDAPYMTPVPHRGKRNEPVYLPYTAVWIANTLNMDPELLMQSTTRNAVSLFKLE